MRRALGLSVVVATAALAVWWTARLGVREDLPPEFAGRRNPLAGAESIAAGAAIFRENCASCHGPEADGHGPASKGLVPPPANFRGGPVLGQHTDAYLYWRVTTGKPGTAMPSFHGALGDTEKWQVVSYLRSLASAPR
jgi:mono/diheme cytochrome c family protein